MLLAVTRDGYGKRVEASAFGKKGRGGMGMIAIKFKESGDSLAALTQASDDEQVLLITQKGTIVRQKVSAISMQGRTATGVQLQKLDPNDYVASVAIVPAEFGRATEDGAAEEGDCRYMAPEFLSMEPVPGPQLLKADIFSTGLTVYEAARLVRLPKNSEEGEDYQELKAGRLAQVDLYSRELQALLRSMVNPVPSLRPTADKLLANHILNPDRKSVV